MTYMSIGHNWNGNYEAWILERDAHDIIVKIDEDLHGDYQYGIDFKGRIDHDKKAISIVPYGGNDERLDFIVSILKTNHPGYAIWFFNTTPKQLVS